MVRAPLCRCSGKTYSTLFIVQSLQTSSMFSIHLTISMSIVAPLWVTSLHSYRVRIKGIDGMCPPGQREMRSLYRIGDPVWVKFPNSWCNSNFKMGQVTGVVSEQSISVNGTPRHVKDLRLAFKTTTLVNDSEWKSYESELQTEPASRETSDSPENPVTDQSESSSREEIQAISLWRSIQNKRTCLHCYLWSWDQEGCDSEWELSQCDPTRGDWRM